jgi:hypothetical protein
VAGGAASSGDPDTVTTWKREGDRPPHRLVRAIRDRPELRAALDALAEGDFGAPTDASGDRLDEAILWMVARAWADDDECLASAVDAIRVAQAIQPVEREVTRHRWFPVPATEREAIFTIEGRWARCSMDADAEERRRAFDALERLMAEQPFPLWRGGLLHGRDEALDGLRDRWESDWPVPSDAWERDLARFHTALDETEPYLDYDGPFATIHEHVPLDHGLHWFSSWQTSHFQIQAQSVLLRAVILYHDGEPIDRVGYRDLRPEMIDSPTRIFFREDTLAGCESMYDAMVTVDPEEMDREDRLWSGAPDPPAGGE